MGTLRYATSVLTLAVMSSSLRAQEPVPVGMDFQVNTYTTGAQTHSQVIANDTGSFIVTWNGAARRFDSSGAPIGDPFPYAGSSASMDASGQWTAVQRVSGSEVRGQRYSPEGTAVGDDFFVAFTTGAGVLWLTVRSFPDSGDFVVIWNSRDTVEGRRFSSAGVGIGNEFQVTDSTVVDMGGPVALGLMNEGSFIVVWEEEPVVDGSTPQLLKARRFSSDGQASPPFQVNSQVTSDYQLRPSVAVSDSGSFLIVWQTRLPVSPANGKNIQGSLFDSQGQRLRGQFNVASRLVGGQSFPKVVADETGAFFVTWRSAGSLGGDVGSESIQGRRLAADGRPFGADFQVNTYTTGDQWDPSVATTTRSGEVVVTWTSRGSLGTDTDNASIQLRRFTPTSAIGDRVWSDLNGDGIQNPGEPGLEDVPVHLVDAASVLLESTSTVAGGIYRFSNIEPGEFSIQVELPDFADGFSPQGVGIDSALDSEVDASGQSPLFLVPQGVFDDDRDVGILGDGPAVFADGFESGDTAAWTQN